MPDSSKPSSMLMVQREFSSPPRTTVSSEGAAMTNGFESAPHSKSVHSDKERDSFLLTSVESEMSTFYEKRSRSDLGLDQPNENGIHIEKTDSDIPHFRIAKVDLSSVMSEKGVKLRKRHFPLSQQCRSQREQVHRHQWTNSKAFL